MSNHGKYLCHRPPTIIYFLKSVIHSSVVQKHQAWDLDLEVRAENLQPALWWNKVNLLLDQDLDVRTGKPPISQVVE